MHFEDIPYRVIDGETLLGRLYRPAGGHLVVERVEATHLPPMLVLQGTADENVEHERADAFVELYRRAGGEIEIHKFPGQPHTFIAKDPASAASREALEKIGNFVQRRIEAGN